MWHCMEDLYDAVLISINFRNMDWESLQDESATTRTGCKKMPTNTRKAENNLIVQKSDNTVISI